MKNTGIVLGIWAIFATVVLFLSCSLEPFGEGLGENGSCDSLNLVNTSCNEPFAPIILYAKILPGQINITWMSDIMGTDNTKKLFMSEPDFFEIYRSTTENGVYTLVGRVDDTEYTDSLGLLAETQYYYKVKSFAYCGDDASLKNVKGSAFSSPFSVTTQSAEIELPAI
jgi:hypothetical protein